MKRKNLTKVYDVSYKLNNKKEVFYICEIRTFSVKEARQEAKDYLQVYGFKDIQILNAEQV